MLCQGCSVIFANNQCVAGDNNWASARIFKEGVGSWTTAKKTDFLYIANHESGVDGQYDSLFPGHPSSIRTTLGVARLYYILTLIGIIYIHQFCTHLCTNEISNIYNFFSENDAQLEWNYN